MTRILFLMLCACVLLGGCAAAGNAQSDAAVTPAAGEPTGWAAISLGARPCAELDCGPMRNHLVMFREVGSRKGGTFHLFVIGTSDGHAPEIDFAKEDRWFLQTYAVPLRPGRYEIHDLEVSAGGGFFSKPRGDLSIPFEVRPGRVTYLGSYVSQAYLGNNFMKQPVLAGIAMMVVDEHERDIAFLAKKHALPQPVPPVDSAVPELTREQGGGMLVRHHAADGRGIEETSIVDALR